MVTAGNAAPNLDMMALWPVDHPTHLLACNEQGPGQPGVQRIDLATGTATTIVTGTQSCDPLHVTPWGTVIFGEETSTGHVYELIDPLSVTNATLNRVTGVASTDKIVQRPALGSVAFEIMTQFRDRMVPGSYLGLSHLSARSAENAREHSRVISKNTGFPEVQFRSDAEVLRFLDGFDLVEPGLVDVTQWYPDEAAPEMTLKLVGAVGRKP